MIENADGYDIGIVVLFCFVSLFICLFLIILDISLFIVNETHSFDFFYFICLP